MKVAVAGGGTGGHIYPAAAVIESLRSIHSPVEVTFIGTGHGLEASIVPALGYRVRRIIARPLPSKPGIRSLFAMISACVGFVQSLFIILFERPSVVIGTGGYASGPFIVAASLGGIPTLLIEPNAIPGRTTMLLARFVDEVTLGFPGAVHYFAKGTNLRVTGIPVRSAVISSKRDDGIKRFGLDPDKKTVLVFGGSRGASSINKALVDAARSLEGTEDLQFLVQTGSQDYDNVSGALKGLRLRSRVHPYIEDIGFAYAASDLVVCRAGAATLSELTARGLPSILIPYPHATWRHQEENARLLEEEGAALVIMDEDLNGEILAKTIVTVISDEETLKRISRNSRDLGRSEASREVATRLVELAARKGRLSKLATVLGEICSAR